MFNKKLLLILAIMTGEQALAKNCTFNGWGVSYKQLFNNLELVLEDFGAVEPIRIGQRKISCPKLKPFVGKFISLDNSCHDMEISVEDGIHLLLEGERSFVGINTGEYNIQLTKTYGYNSVITKLIQSKITEEMRSMNNKLVSKSELELVEKNKIKFTVLSSVNNSTNSKTCFFERSL